MTSYMLCLFAVLMEHPGGPAPSAGRIETLGEVGRCLDARNGEVGKHALPGAAFARFPFRGLVLGMGQSRRRAAIDVDAIAFSAPFFAAPSPPVGAARGNLSLSFGLSSPAEGVGREAAIPPTGAPADRVRPTECVAAAASARRPKESLPAEAAVKMKTAAAAPDAPRLAALASTFPERRSGAIADLLFNPKTVDGRFQAEGCGKTVAYRCACRAEAAPSATGAR